MEFFFVVLNIYPIFFCTFSISDLFPENTVVTITMLSTSQMSSLMRNRKFVMLITVRLRVYKSSWVLDLCLIIFMHHSSETISKLILEVWSRPLIPLKHKNVWTCRIEQEDSKALKQKCTWYVHHYFHHNTRCSTA